MRTGRIAFFVVVAALLAVGCSKGKKKETHAYTVRAVVDKAPAAGVVYLHHEAVPDFVDAFGDTLTMKSMTMGFALGSVDPSTVAKGDVVEVHFHTDWDTKPTLRIDSIKKLPPDTQLDLK